MEVRLDSLTGEQNQYFSRQLETINPTLLEERKLLSRVD